MGAVVAILIAASLVAGLIPVIRRVALRRGWVDRPDAARKQHDRAVPRLGGVALAAGIAAGGLALVVTGARPSLDLWPLFGSAALLWAVGLWDDLYGLGFKRKFIFQILGAYALLLMGWHLDLAPLPFVGEMDLYGQALLAIPLTLVWLVGVVNAVNLIDGHDGLAAGVSMIAFAALGTLALVQHQSELAAFCFVVSAALAGFLAYNWAPASIFMGDSGSLLLGLLLGGVALRLADAATTPRAFVAPAVVLGLPILDTLASMTRRLLEGKSPFAPDADHIHHRMVRAAGSVRLGVLTLYAVGSGYAILGVALGTFGHRAALPVLAVLVVLSYLLLRQLSYVRARVVLRRLQRRWRQHHRAVRLGHRPPLHRSLFLAPLDGRQEYGVDTPSLAPKAKAEQTPPRRVEESAERKDRMVGV